jgi:hypothetical protein
MQIADIYRQLSNRYVKAFQKGSENAKPTQTIEEKFADIEAHFENMSLKPAARRSIKLSLDKIKAALKPAE